MSEVSDRVLTPGNRTSEGWVAFFTVVLTAIGIAANLRAGSNVVNIDSETLSVIGGGVAGLYVFCRTILKVFVGR